MEKQTSHEKTKKQNKKEGKANEKSKGKNRRTKTETGEETHTAVTEASSHQLCLGLSLPAL